MGWNIPRICVRCGAPLTGRKCEYCGTEYSGSCLKGTFDTGNYTGELTVGNENIQCYISSIEFDIVDGPYVRYVDGALVMSHNVTKRTITLVEI